jgi:hypothetical protein
MITQAMSAVFRANDEESHETVLFFLSDNRASAYQLTVPLSCNESIQVGGPKHLGIVQAGVSTLARCPFDQRVQLIAGHSANVHVVRRHYFLFPFPARSFISYVAHPHSLRS